MNRTPHPPPDNAANSEAINRVLQAEQDAQQAVARCERQAQELLHGAQMQVQRIHQRADERITWMEMRCAQWLSEQSRQLALADSTQTEAGGGVHEAALSGLVEALAARLTTGDEGAS